MHKIKIGTRVRHPKCAGIGRVTKNFLDSATLSARFANGNVEQEPRRNFTVVDRDLDPDMDGVRDGDCEEAEEAEDARPFVEDSSSKAQVHPIAAETAG